MRLPLRLRPKIVTKTLTPKGMFPEPSRQIQGADFGAKIVVVRQALGSVAGAFGLLEVDQIVFFILGSENDVSNLSKNQV
ncbi:MAG: hypothetical protein WA869_13735 [Alloacidobacterium sp.]